MYTNEYREQHFQEDEKRRLASLHQEKTKSCLTAALGVILFVVIIVVLALRFGGK